MSENQVNTQPVETPATDTNVETKVEKTFTQTDLDNLASKVRSEEKSKRDSLINEAVSQAIKEYERKAKLSEEEREKEAKTEREKALSQREKEITLRERTIEAKELLSKKGLSSELVNYVVNEDGDKMKSDIEDLAKTFNKLVEGAIQEKLKGQAPKDFSTQKPETNIPKSGLIF